MNSAEIRKKVKQFRREFSLRDCSLRELEQVFAEQGFTIIAFNPVVNDPDVETVIHALHLEDMIAKSSGFIYTDSNYRLLFINEKLSAAEKRVVYAHEEGHYYCGHTKTPAMVGRSVQEEYEANEFAHYLLEGSFSVRAKQTVRRHRKLALAGGIAAALAAGGAGAASEYQAYQERMLYEGEYYVTMHGEKYHLENCVTIEGHETRRLTKEDVEAGRYEPCSVCMPDKDKK